MATLTRRDLDTLKCSREHCDEDACSGEMAIHGACHEEVSPWAFYRDGVLTFKCSICDQVIAQVAVADG